MRCSSTNTKHPSKMQYANEIIERIMLFDQLLVDTETHSD